MRVCLEDISELLGLPLVGVIPESNGVLTSTSLGQPIILKNEDHAAEAYKDTVQRFLGHDLPLLCDRRDQGFFTRIMEAARLDANCVTRSRAVAATAR